MNRKKKGANAELEAVHLLESLGYQVTKAGGSLGAYDLVAVHPTHVRYIQVKSNRRPGSVEMEGLLSARLPPSCSVEVWVRHDNRALVAADPGKRRWVVEVL